jgi:hypothetical protein
VEVFGPSDFHNRNGPEAFFDFRRQRAGGVVDGPDEQDGAFFETRLQFGIQAAVTVIFHFAVGGVIDALTGKKRVDNRLICIVPIAVSLFHKSPPLAIEAAVEWIAPDLITGEIDFIRLYYSA